MKPSTKHALLQRMLSLFGVCLAMATPKLPILWIAGTPLWCFLLGIALAAIGIFSGFGVGPWGRHFKKLYVNDHRAEIGRPPLR